MKYVDEETLGRRRRFLLLLMTVMLLFCIGVSVMHFHAPTYKERMKVGIIMQGSRGDPGWTRTHYRAIHDAGNALGLDILVRENIREHTSGFQKAIKELYESGAKYIFLTSDAYIEEMSYLAGQYPDVRFAITGVESSAPGLINYSGRFYEARYLSGVLAGRRTKTGVLGYVAQSPVAEVSRGINAFALGAQSVRPDVKVVVAWTGEHETHGSEAVKNLVGNKADIIAYHHRGREVADAAEAAGVDFIGLYEEYPELRHCLTTIEMNWENAYLSILEGTNISIQSNGSRCYWPGTIEGQVFLTPVNPRLALPGDEESLDAARARVLSGQPIFAGELYDRHGRMRCKEGESMPSKNIASDMTWLLKGVETLGRQ